MCIYFVANCIIYLFLIISNFCQKKYTQRLFAISCGIWALIIGLRGYGVQNDTSAYASYFAEIWYGLGIFPTNYGTISDPEDTMEIGFVAITRILNFISSSPTFWFLLQSTFIFYLIYLLYKKANEKYALWAFLLYLVMNPTQMSPIMGAMRQMLSVGLCMCSIFYIERVIENDHEYSYRKIYKDKNIAVAIAFFLIALITHRSSALLLPLVIILYFVPIKKIYAYILIALAFLFSVSFKDVLSSYVDFALTAIGSFKEEDVAILGERYAGMLNDEDLGLFVKFSRTSIAILTIYFLDDKETKSISYKCMLVSIIMFLVFSGSFMIARLTLIFNLIGAAIYIPKAVENNKTLRYIYVILTSMFLIKTYSLYENWNIKYDAFLPYYFFWEQ